LTYKQVSFDTSYTQVSFDTSYKQVSFDTYAYLYTGAPEPVPADAQADVHGEGEGEGGRDGGAPRRRPVEGGMLLLNPTFFNNPRIREASIPAANGMGRQKDTQTETQKDTQTETQKDTQTETQKDTQTAIPAANGTRRRMYG